MQNLSMCIYHNTVYFLKIVFPEMCAQRCCSLAINAILTQSAENDIVKMPLNRVIADIMGASPLKCIIPALQNI